MNKFNFDQGDDLGDFLGQPSQGPRPLPQDDASVRIRQDVPIFEEICRKCGGSGQFRSYSGRALGKCFGCKGAGKHTFKSSPEAREQGKAYRAALPGKRWDIFQAAHPAEAAFLVAKLAQSNLPTGYRDTLISIKDAIDKYGDTLSDGRMLVLQRGVARDEEHTAKRQERVQERVQQAPAVDASQIVAAFQRGREAGVQRLILRFSGLRIKEAKKFPGTLYVTSTLRQDQDGKEAYLGKIVEGRFQAARDCSPEEQAKVILIASDPAGAAKIYGLETGECCVCGRELTNAESVTTGIGPICSGRMNWTPGGIVKRAGVDF